MLDLVRRIATWRRGSERAPHKPLLLLYALGRLEAEEEPFVSYRDVDQDLGDLLTDFGPPRASVHPEYPLWRLQRDELGALGVAAPGAVVAPSETSKRASGAAVPSAVAARGERTGASR